MARCMARCEHRFQVPAAVAVGSGAKVKAVAIVQMMLHRDSVPQLVRRPRMSPDRDVVALGTDRGGADVIGVMMRQDDVADTSPLGRGGVQSIKQALLFVRVH